jgi:Family of unknown function (DUF5681)
MMPESKKSKPVKIHPAEHQKRRPQLAAPWQPGQSGNPAGRPPGSRNKYSEDVLTVMANDWAAGGADVVARVRATDPSTYLRVVASILPKDVLVNVQQSVPGNLQPEAWASLRRVLDLIESCGASGEPQEVFEMIEEDLRARLAKPVEGT